MSAARPRRIGWYVHHHGRGHLTRLLAIAPHLEAEIACFSSLPVPDALPANCTWAVLERDDDTPAGARAPGDADPTAGGILHWAPVQHPGHRSRLAAVVAALAAHPVDAFVVDVSVEVALLARLLGVPTVLIAQPGVRDDAPHALAFQAATAIVAPWPGDLLAPDHLSPYIAKTTYTGGISRFEGRTPASGGPGEVVLLGGAGGTAVSAAEIAAAEHATGAPWRVLGGAAWTADPWAALTTARVVVSWAGQNAVADLAAATAPAVIVPQDRPFDEQQQTAAALGRAGLAVVSGQWPEPGAWPGLLAEAEGSTPAWERWRVAGAAARAADAILRAAES